MASAALREMASTDDHRTLVIQQRADLNIASKTGRLTEPLTQRLHYRGIISKLARFAPIDRTRLPENGG